MTHPYRLPAIHHDHHHHHFGLIMDNSSPHSIKVSGRQFEGRKAICGFAIMIDLPKEVALVDIISTYIFLTGDGR